MIGLFVITFVVTATGGALDRLKYRRWFQSLARSVGQETSGAWPSTVRANVEGRPFDITYNHFVRTRNSSYRGPTGHVLTVATPLAGSHWSTHQADIEKAHPIITRITGVKLSTTGDEAFDNRFQVVEDGLPVRTGWLDAATRAAITQFLNAVPLEGPLRVREGTLQYVMGHPWKGLDGAALKSLLARHAALATAFERTAHQNSRFS